MSFKHRSYSLLFQIIIVLIFSIDSKTEKYKEYWENLTISVAKYIYCNLLIKGAKGAFDYLYSSDKSDILSVFDGNLKKAILFSIASTILVQTDKLFVGRQLVEVFIVYLLIENTKEKSANTISNIEQQSIEKKVECETKPSINYGTGMACSYLEGYLLQVLPNDGGAFHGIENNIKMAEASMGVRFPVKRLFIIITKSMYCPPELTEFNMEDKKRPYLERCRPLADIQRNVAGVIDRTYRNSVYKIHRGGQGGSGGKPICIVAECASPLNTLYKVLQKRVLYQTLSEIDVAAVVRDFCETLQTILSRSNECKNKCELVHIDDTNPEENLADILLDRIRQIAPNFEQIIEQTD